MAGIDIEQLLSGLTGNDTINQLFIYQIVGQLIGLLTGPLAVDIQQALASHFPTVQLSPADAASAVVRGFLDQQAGIGEAANSGIDAQRFATLVRLAGAAPAPGALAEALRRGIIPEDSGNPDEPGYIQGIREGDTANKWAEMFVKLSTALPGPSLAVDAAVRGQVDAAQGQHLYEIFGGDPAYFQLSFDTTGQPPSPLEAATMARRGIIPQQGLGADVTSFQQAVAESGYKNKWEPVYWQLSEYHPPPRTVTAMFGEGQLSHDDALKELIGSGLSPELAAAYLQPKAKSTTSTPHKLAVSTIEKLYTDQIIDATTATSMLTAIGYSEQDAQFYLEIMDLAVTEAQMSSIIGRIRTLYIAHKIDKTTAVNALGSLELPGKQLNGIIQTWDLARAANQTNLSAATIAGALKYKIVTADDAMTALQHIGFTPYDAWLFLSEHLHAPIGPAPSQALINPGAVPG
jgi:hypothetical protein